MTNQLNFVATYGTARRAASDAAAGQNYPPGTLYLVATPIGNLADITLRALHLLELADCLACEDTRHSQALLRAYGIDKMPSQWLAVHQHNEALAAHSVIERLRAGARVAYLSDAGTPAVSDPGARLVAALHAAGLPVMPLPGASSVTTLFSAAGVVANADQGFVFAGFLPQQSAARQAALQTLAGESRAVVLLEAPHRIEALAVALGALGQRQLTVGRELTKQFEEIVCLAAQDFAAWLKLDRPRLRGEFALVLHPAPDAEKRAPDTRVLNLLLAQLPLKTAVKLCAEITGESRHALYQLALSLQRDY